MAIVIKIEPTSKALVSTLIPLVLEVEETTASTTNIIASCYWIDQTTAVETQVGAKFRMAPQLGAVDKFVFDASEIFNTLTKYTLNDAPNSWKLGANTGNLNYQIWEDIATWNVIVKFQREYLDPVTGLIVLDPAFTDSNDFFVHEGCPEKNWLKQIDENTAGNPLTYDLIFYYFRMVWNSGVYAKRFLTNYPIKESTATRKYSLVDIHESEQYVLAFWAPASIYCGFEISISTFDSAATLFQTHTQTITPDSNFATLTCGFRDLQNSLTPSAAEGNVAGSLFANVASYTVDMMAATNTVAPCVFTLGSTTFDFKVDRSCIKNGGYLRFCFKNMLGGFDMVSSRGEYTEKIQNKFEEFEQGLGNFDWVESMAFGKSNWANKNVKSYSVTTHAMKPKYAEHFAEMFSSTQVYLRVKNESNLKVYSAHLNTEAEDVPYKFYPLVIKSGTKNIFKTTENLVKLSFDFDMAVNQRNPRY